MGLGEHDAAADELEPERGRHVAPTHDRHLFDPAVEGALHGRPERMCERIDRHPINAARR